jgi:hypothetical protein
VPIEYEVKVVEKIFTMLANGQSRFKIAETLNVQGIPTKSSGKWHPLTIQRMATNTSYVGKTYFFRTTGSHKTALIQQAKDKWVVLPEVTPAIIGKELFDQVQKRLEQTSEARTGHPTHQYLLRGHAYCGICGSPLVGSWLNKRWLYYRCRATTPTTTGRHIELASPEILGQYVNDLRKLLMLSEITDKKAFIRIFVQDIKVVGDKATLTYAKPLNGLIEQKIGVLPIVHYGGR